MSAPAPPAKNGKPLSERLAEKPNFSKRSNTPGCCGAEGFTEHELGPALIFEHDLKAIRLDHFLAESHEHLTVDQRLDLLRQVTEVMRFAHPQLPQS